MYSPESIGILQKEDTPMKRIDDLSVADLWREFKEYEDDFWERCEEEVIKLKKRLLEEALEEERRELVLCDAYERTEERKGYRNGYWERYITVVGGRLKIRMPRIRESGYKSQVIPRYKRRMQEVDGLLQQIFLYGVSTRLTGEVLKPILGEELSAQTISNIAKSLDKEVKAYHIRPISDGYIYLFLDGIVKKVRTGLGSRKKVVLAAYGVTEEGGREIIDFMVTTHESEHRWDIFLKDLYERGLKGSKLRLIVTDGNRGLENAVDYWYPGVKRQRCWVHKLRNVSNYLRRKDQKPCIEGARQIYNAKTKREATRKFLEWSQKWRDIYPKAVKCIEKDIEELLNFLTCPEEHHKLTRTTNAIERSFREVRRRTRPMSCFNNTQSIERIVFAVIHNLNTRWRNRPLKNFTQNC